MAIRRSAGMRAAGNRGKRAQSRKRDDGFSTTPTQYGERSPDYVKQAGDPDYLKSYSEEQISLMGGRDRIFEIVAAKEQRARDQAATLTEGGIESGGTTPGPTEPPTTYGSDPFSEYGLPGGLPNSDGSMSTADMTEPGGGNGKGPGGKPDKTPSPVKKRPTHKPGSPAAKKKFQRRVAKATGTSLGEAKGIMRKARTQVRRGNKVAARRTITRALSGGPKRGVPRTPARSAKARVAAKKVTRRIATRQAQAAPKRRKK